MHYFPIFMDLRDQVTVLIGAGKVAERKARLLLQAGACVHVVAREINAQFSQWIAAGRVLHVAREYQAELLRGARLVFVATGDTQLNSRVFSDAEQVSVPVNVVDDRKLCRFISPAVVDRSPIQVAISTGGSAPLLARRLRSWIEALLPLGLGQVASAAGDVRRFARERLPKSQRKTVWEKLLGDERLRSFSLQSRRDIGHSMRREIEKAAVDEQAHTPQRGRVFLVGAGPGRADLLTLRALHVLAMADVILHDGLVSEEILNLARRDADRINVGKRAGKTHLAQQDIHACMVAEASKGKNVVRLKGGDAFIFGRGGEELQHLRQYDVPYEVVPGITAALACAAYSGIPLTHRDYAQSLTLITGHLATGKESAPDTDRPVIDWAGIAGAGKTAAVYMGVQQAAGIRKALLQAGVDADLPVALVVNGSLDTQFVLHGRIENMARMAVQAGSDSPGLLIIGQVAALGSSLNWFGESALLQSAA